MLKLTTDNHKALPGLLVTAELLVIQCASTRKCPYKCANFQLPIAKLVTEIWRGSQNEKWELLISPLAGKFLHGAIGLVPANAYQRTKFQLPSSISYRYMEGVPK